MRRLGAGSGPVLVTTAVVSILTVQCRDLELASRWRDRNITIDGKGGDWATTKAYLQDQAVAIGFANDDDYLYLHVSTWDRRVRMQVLRSGLTIRFQAGGNETSELGIRFPIENMAESRISGKTGMVQDDPGMMDAVLEAANRGMEVLGPGKRDTTYMRTMKAYPLGIEAVVGLDKGEFVYEMKVPLRVGKNCPYAVGADTAGLVMVGFEAAGLNLPAGRPQGRSPGAGKPGGRGGMRGGGGVRGGGGKGGMHGSAPSAVSEELKLRVSVVLARDPLQEERRDGPIP